MLGALSSVNIAIKQLFITMIEHIADVTVKK